MLKFGEFMLLEASKADKIWYHGSDNKFDEFDQNKLGEASRKMGFWFTDDKSFAEMFGTHLIEVKLTCKNPKIMSMDKWDSLRLKHKKQTEPFIELRNKLVKEGFDALLVSKRTNTLFGGHTFVDPNVICVFNVKDITFIK